MIEPYWLRICGIHVEADGVVGAVWLAEDRQTGVFHLYDAARFQDTVPAVLVEGIAARGRYIPVAWRKKDKPAANILEDAGINVIPEPAEDSPELNEMDSRQVSQMLMASQLRVERRVSTWLAEFNKFYKRDSKVPAEGFPLMAATRHALRMSSWAQPERSPYASRSRSPQLKVL